MSDMTHNVFEQNENVVFSSDVHLHDISRDPYPKPCPDCKREHLNGEHVIWQVPTNIAKQGSMRIVWEGCADCWIRRTNLDGIT